jgi:hypothetical protein
MRPEPRRTAERLGLDQAAIRWLEAHGHLQRLALSEPEIRARLYHAHLAHLLPRTIPGSRATRSFDGVPLRLVVIRGYRPDD